MKRGFTIIELLVVVAIISLLVSFVLVQLSQSRAKARDTRRVADINTLVTGLVLYNNQTGEYPNPYTNEVINGSDSISNALRAQNVLMGIIRDPMNSDPYQYKYSSAAGSTFSITYYLETNSVYSKNQGLNTIEP